MDTAIAKSLRKSFSEVRSRLNTHSGERPSRPSKNRANANEDTTKTHQPRSRLGSLAKFTGRSTSKESTSSPPKPPKNTGKTPPPPALIQSSEDVHDIVSNNSRSTNLSPTASGRSSRSGSFRSDLRRSKCLDGSEPELSPHRETVRARSSSVLKNGLRLAGEVPIEQLERERKRSQSSVGRSPSMSARDRSHTLQSRARAREAVAAASQSSTRTPTEARKRANSLQRLGSKERAGQVREHVLRKIGDSKSTDSLQSNSSLGSIKMPSASAPATSPTLSRCSIEIHDVIGDEDEDEYNQGSFDLCGDDDDDDDDDGATCPRSMVRVIMDSQLCDEHQWE